MLRLVRLWRPGRVCWFSVLFAVIVSFVCGYFWLHGLICKLCSCRKEILESALWCRLVQWSNSSVDLLKDSVAHSAIFTLQPNTYHYNIFRLLLCFPVLFICCCYFLMFSDLSESIVRKNTPVYTETWVKFLCPSILRKVLIMEHIFSRGIRMCKDYRSSAASEFND